MRARAGPWAKRLTCGPSLESAIRHNKRGNPKPPACATAIDSGLWLVRMSLVREGDENPPPRPLCRCGIYTRQVTTFLSCNLPLQRLTLSKYTSGMRANGRSGHRCAPSRDGWLSNNKYKNTRSELALGQVKLPKYGPIHPDREKKAFVLHAYRCPLFPPPLRSSSQP